MEQGSFTSIVEHGQQQYSEKFCQYSLYKVALGLKNMHENNVLHRDLKADNILHSVESGDVKIADLGVSCALTKEKN